MRSGLPTLRTEGYVGGANVQLLAWWEGYASTVIEADKNGEIRVGAFLYHIGDVGRSTPVFQKLVTVLRSAPEPFGTTCAGQEEDLSDPPAS